MANEGGPTEPTVYDGSANQQFNSQLLAHTAVEYMPRFRQVIFNAFPLLKVFAVNAFGKDQMVDHGRFGNAESVKSSDKGIEFHDGGAQFEFPLLTTAPTGKVIGRMGNVNPEYKTPAVTGAYAYKRMYWSVYVPEEAIMDNRGNQKMMSWLDNQLKMAQLAAARDINYVLNSHSSAPTGFTTEGLPHMVSVTQGAASNATGRISASANTYWQNKINQVISVGGGGEFDRPLVFLRKLEALILAIRELGGSSNDQVLAATKGAYQYYRRAIYADATGRGATTLVFEKYDAVALDHSPFMGAPLMYDGFIQVPNGGTASREAVYVLDLNELKLHVKRDQFFHVENWDMPRAKDDQRFAQLNIWFRGIPAVTDRRIQGVAYDIPANPDVVS